MYQMVSDKYGYPDQFESPEELEAICEELGWYVQVSMQSQSPYETWIDQDGDTVLVEVNEASVQAGAVAV